MDMSLDPGDPRAPYRQVADALRAEIESGELERGSRFPTHGQVAERFSVSIGTVKRAYATLQQEGLIVTRQGQGSFVTQSPEPAVGRTNGGTDVDRRLAELQSELRSLAQRVRRLESTQS